MRTKKFVVGFCPKWDPLWWGLGATNSPRDFPCSTSNGLSLIGIPTAEVQPMVLRQMTPQRETLSSGMICFLELKLTTFGRFYL